MKRCLTSIAVGLLTFALVGFNALTAVANIRPIPLVQGGALRPFHLVEHGTLTPNPDGSIFANGKGTATLLGHISVKRTFNLTPTSVANELKLEGEATLFSEKGDKLETGLEGILTVDPGTNTGHAVLTYRWEGGTGRFANATGTTIWNVDVDLADNTYEVFAYGVIKL
jgi:hypothetical protein